ncbi:hypothetical protein [Aquimarina latercula]|uniref:hypothetical protein n=1 Tax=Aquimarina latercula TaxID=987 RepID=UPI000425F452|nr:hypothetical protein [Aquimarina latercula]
MKKSELEKNKFLALIVKSLRITEKEFKQNLDKRENYEITINQWSTNLFNEGKTSEEAIKIVNERISLVLCNSKEPKPNPQNLVLIKNHQKVMDLLQVNPIYSSLNTDEKHSIQNRIDAFVKTDLYTPNDVVNIILKVIQNTMPDRTGQANNVRNINDLAIISRVDKIMNYKTLNNSTLFKRSIAHSNWD